MLTAYAHVKTDQAERYLKALCNHFNRKVTASYDDQHGEVQFGFGYCQLDASADTLSICVQAEDEAYFSRVKYVVSDHLERFAKGKGLQVTWVDQE